jgi:hypothetical protein
VEAVGANHAWLHVLRTGFLPETVEECIFEVHLGNIDPKSSKKTILDGYA